MVLLVNLVKRKKKDECREGNMYRNEGDRQAITMRYGKRVRKKHEEDAREKHGLAHERKTRMSADVAHAEGIKVNSKNPLRYTGQGRERGKKNKNQENLKLSVIFSFVLNLI